MAKRIGRHVTAMWRRFWRSWIRLPILAGLIAIGLIGLAMAVAVYDTGRHDDGARGADVIVVLGAGVEKDARPTAATARRAAHAAALYRQGAASAIICAGGFAVSRPISEAAACGGALASLGVPDDTIWLEEWSKSTEENAIYALALMREHGWRSALVVSDNYHLLRARLVFEQRGVPLAGVSPAQATAGPLSPLEYVRFLGREVVGMYWQGFKVLLGLPNTHVDAF